MITLRKLTLARGAKFLLAGADATVHPGQRIGVVGANGSGKSSLFALLCGELHQEEGDVEMPPRLSIARVAQETPALAQAAIEYVLDGDERFRRAEQAMVEADRQGDGVRVAETHAAYAEIDGYALRARAAKIMHGLGFGNDVLQKPVAEFSGGWRVRLNLARALTCPSDLLLLDEPTNHLDLDAVLWLEEWLRSYPGTLLVISHDRDFLDGVVEHIWHLEARELRRYSGNYTAFEQQRAAQLAQRQAMYEKQQRVIAHMQSFIDRFRAKATKAKAAQSRLKALARMEVISAAHVDTPFSFQFRPAQAVSRVLVKLEEVAAGYADHAVLRDIELSVEHGMRLALLGANGAGKSTLVKLLAGVGSPLSGELTFGKHCKVGYFAQHQLEQLRADESPLRHMLRLDAQTPEQQLRDYLGGFDFRGEMVDAAVGAFSGGEKARLALALIIWQRPNLLLLDEPTNHLDLDMRQALVEALQEFEGAVVLVSHDRHLLRTSTDQFLLVADGRVEAFDGDLDDYRDLLKRSRNVAETQDAGMPALSSRKDERRREAQERQRLSQLRKPLETKSKQLEASIERLTGEKNAVDSALGDQGIYAEQRKEELKTLLLRQSQLSKELEETETQWLELQQRLEAIE